MKTKRLYFITTVAMIIGLTGCTPSSPPSMANNQVSESDVSLGESIAAFYLSRQSAGFTGETGDGYVGLLAPSGEVSVLRTSGMDNGQLDWNEAGLVFADTGHDYHLADSLTKTKSSKTNFQQAIFATDNGGSLGLYNDGFTDEGYVDQFVTTSSESAQMREVEGNYSVTGLCDGNIFGTAEPSGPYAKEAEQAGHTLMGDFELRSQMLAQLDPGSQQKERVISIQTVDEGSQFSSDAPCENGQLFHLASLVPDSHTRSLALRVWNVDTGDFTQHPITLMPGTEPLVNNDLGYELDGYDSASLRDGRFDWVTIDGRVLSTNIIDGATEEIFTLAADGYDPENPLRAVEFTQTTVEALTVDSSAGSASFVVYDRETGQELDRLDVPNISEALEAGLVLRDMAVLPK